MTWNTFEHSTGQCVIPEKREGTATLGTGILDAPNFLNFSSRACGNQPAINETNVLIVSKKSLATMRATWPMSNDPSIQPFMRFLENRQTDRGGSLRDLLGPPTEYGGGWHMFPWKDGDQVPKTTLNPTRPGSSSTWLPAWQTRRWG